MGFNAKVGGDVSMQIGQLDRGQMAVTVLSDDIELNGALVEVKSLRALVIEGTVKASIKTAGAVLIARGAKLQGNLQCGALFVCGAVQGEKINVRGLFQVRSGGSVHAQEIEYGLIEQLRGAVLRGKLTMNDAGDPGGEPVAPDDLVLSDAYERWLLGYGERSLADQVACANPELAGAQSGSHSSPQVNLGTLRDLSATHRQDRQPAETAADAAPETHVARPAPTPAAQAAQALQAVQALQDVTRLEQTLGAAPGEGRDASRPQSASMPRTPPPPCLEVSIDSPGSRFAGIGLSDLSDLGPRA